MPEELVVTITYGQLRIELRGTPDVVIRGFNEFISKHIPMYELAGKLILNYSTNDIISIFSEHIRFTPEGSRIWAVERLSDKEVIALQLVASKLEYLLGKRASPNLSVSELESMTAIKAKSTSSRLSELVKSNYVERDEVGGKTSYKITTLGISWLREALLKKRKSS